MSAAPDDLLADADRAVASGDIRRAAQLLEDAARNSPDNLELWLKLASMQRASGDADAALESVHRGLELAPLDFTLLLMRASLLQRMGRADAGEAWGHALAQRPDEIPAPFTAIVAEAEKRHAAFVDQREERLRSAMASAESRADPEQKRRIERFRDNSLRKTRHFHSSPTEFHFPELVEREFHPRRLFPWLEALEAATDALAAELQDFMATERAELVPYVQYDPHLPVAQWRPLNHNLDWAAIHLLQCGKIVEANARQCPQTMALLDTIPQPNIPGASPNAMFSLLAPHTAIPAHVGVNNARLVCHLPLVVPEGCWFRVGAEKRFWKRGEALVFDDTIEHEALNPSDDLRAVLIFDVWHPDLSEIEKEAVAALVGAHGAPGEL